MDQIVGFALKQRVLVVILLLCALVGGLVSFFRLNIEAYPDPVPPLVDIVTQSSGQSAEEIERYITIPIEIQMAGIPYVTAVRTISLFGLSDVKIQFTYDFTYEQAEQWVINRLAQLPPLPDGAQPQISPESPIGEIFRYRVVGPPGYSVEDLKTLEDWVLERRFKAVPGVIDVTGWGGKTKTYDVTIDQNRLVSYGLTVPQVLQALGNADINVGGQTVNFGPQAIVVRGVGLVHSMDDIRNTMLAAPNGVPVLVRDVATVAVGHEPRLGVAGQNDDEDIVEGIVLMRRGEKSTPTIAAVKQEVAKINRENVLPPGVHIDTVYDRSALINVTTHTVLENMILGIVLIFAVQWLFLGDLRCALIVATTIPFALACAIGLMVARGQSANLLSVGAIDFGLVVDATVIMVENIFRHLSESPEARRAGYPFLQTARVGHGFRGKFAVIANAGLQVNRAIFFAAAIIIAGFVPLFTMSGIEGHIFGPMAQTYAYAIAGGLVATFTVAPVLSSFLLDDGMQETETPVVVFLRRRLRPMISFALANRILTLGLAGLLIVLALAAFNNLGLEFLPKLEEGNLWIRATLPPSISLEEGAPTVNRIREIIAGFPEVETVISQHGRPDDGTDATGFFNAEFFVPLKPTSKWPRGVDKEKLTAQVSQALESQFVGIEFNFSQYIEDNVEEAASGVKGENSVKLFGNDLETLEKTAAQIRDVMAQVPGITDLSVFNSLGQPTVQIDVDRERAARFGLAPGDVNAVVQAAIGGQSSGDLYESGSDRHFPIVARLALKDRASLETMRRVAVAPPNTASPNGTANSYAWAVSAPGPVVLGDVAKLSLVSGASFIYREQQERYIPIKFSVRGRDLGSAVLEAQNLVNSRVRIPGGYHLEWVGEFGNLEEALQRLEVVIPLSILLIGILLYFNFGSVSDTLLAASVIPMALTGGVFALFVSGTPVSVSAVIGFVALFGISAMDGIIVISYFNQQVRGGLARADAINRTVDVQLRPVLMTCIVACVGLLPAAVSTGIGSQVQKPLAIVVVGGMLFAPILILIVLPVIISLVGRERVASVPEAEE